MNVFPSMFSLGGTRVRLSREHWGRGVLVGLGSGLAALVPGIAGVRPLAWSILLAVACAGLGWLLGVAGWPKKRLPRNLLTALVATCPLLLIGWWGMRPLTWEFIIPWGVGFAVVGVIDAVVRGQ